MVNLSGIPNQTLIGKVLRAPLRLIPQSTVVPILQGPLRGKRWIVGSATNGCWIGSYEHEKQYIFWRSLRPNDVVYDIGANVGFYTLLAASIAQQVFAIEPFPENIRYLKQHIKLNHLSNCTVVEAAFGSTDGQASFSPASDRHSGHLSDSGPLTVPVISMDSLLLREGFAPPTLLKVDIEGAEAEFLRGAANTIRTCHPKIFLATHGTEVRKACLTMLGEWGYQCRPLDGSDVESCDEFVADSAGTAR